MGERACRDNQICSNFSSVEANWKDDSFLILKNHLWWAHGDRSLSKLGFFSRALISFCFSNPHMILLILLSNFRLTRRKCNHYLLVCDWTGLGFSLATWLHLSKELHYECTTLHATPFPAFSTLIVFFGVIWSAQKKSRVVWFSLSSPFILVGSIFCFFFQSSKPEIGFFLHDAGWIETLFLLSFFSIW